MSINKQGQNKPKLPEVVDICRSADTSYSSPRVVGPSGELGSSPAALESAAGGLGLDVVGGGLGLDAAAAAARVADLWVCDPASALAGGEKAEGGEQAEGGAGAGRGLAVFPTFRRSRASIPAVGVKTSSSPAREGDPSESWSERLAFSVVSTERHHSTTRKARGP